MIIPVAQGGVVGIQSPGEGNLKLLELKEGVKSDI